MINQTRNGRWRVRVKSGGAVVADQTFDLKKHAEEWEREQKTRLLDGSWVDPRRGKVAVSVIRDAWLAARSSQVSSKTFQTDEYLLRVYTPQKFLARPIGSVDTSEVKEVLAAMTRKGLAFSTVARYRATLSSMFSSAVEDKIIRANPVRAAKTPKGNGASKRHEVYPFSLTQLRGVYQAQKEHNEEQSSHFVPGSYRLALGRNGGLAG